MSRSHGHRAPSVPRPCVCAQWVRRHPASMAPLALEGCAQATGLILKPTRDGTSAIESAWRLAAPWFSKPKHNAAKQKNDCHAQRSLSWHFADIASACDLHDSKPWERQALTSVTTGRGTQRQAGPDPSGSMHCWRYPGPANGPGHRPGPVRATTARQCGYRRQSVAA